MATRSALSVMIAALGLVTAANSQIASRERIAANVVLEVDARIGADDLMALALEQFAPVFASVTTDDSDRQNADLIGRLELWRYGNVPGAGWTCIADIALELYTPDGELIFREIGRGCGATKLRKGLFEDALAELARQLTESGTLREFVRTGSTTAAPSSHRPRRLEDTFELAQLDRSGRVSWDLALDPTRPRQATLLISDTRRRSEGIRQINIRGSSVETLENPAGLPVGSPISLSGSSDAGLLAQVEQEQFRYTNSSWQTVDGFAPCFSKAQSNHEGICGVVVRGSVVDSPRRWRVDVIGGSGISAPAILPLPMPYRAPKLVVASAPLDQAPFYVVLDRETTLDFSPQVGALGVQAGWQYLPWQMQLDAAGNAYVLARTSRPQELRFARIPFPALATEAGAGLPPAATSIDDERSLAEAIEAGRLVDVASVPIGESCTTCSQALAVNRDSGTALILSREKRDTWYATFVDSDGEPETKALPDTIWPLRVLPGQGDRFYVLGYLPLALANVPGRLGIYSLSPDEPIRHEITLSTSTWALLPPVAFERDPNTGSILTVWHSARESLHAAWYDAD